MAQPALTHLSTCMIQFPFSYAESFGSLEQRLSQVDAQRRETELETLEHELMHFYQAVTTNYLFNISTDYFRATSSASQNIRGQTRLLRAAAFHELGAASNQSRLGCGASTAKACVLSI